jgi:hypothetical protein
LSGYGQLNAHAYQDCVCYTSIKSLENLDAKFDTVQNDGVDAVIRSVFPLLTQNDKIDVTDNDNEDETNKISSFKKYLETNKYFTTLFNTQTPQYFCHCVKKRLSVFKNSFNFSSYRRYIIFRVIRI